jgi:hypothetical protein
LVYPFILVISTVSSKKAYLKNIFILPFILIDQQFGWIHTPNILKVLLQNVEHQLLLPSGGDRKLGGNYL